MKIDKISNKGVVVFVIYFGVGNVWDRVLYIYTAVLIF